MLPGDKKILAELQPYITDSLVIHKTFVDKSGKNNLEIKVVNPCKRSENAEEKRVDGWLNYISVRLSNKSFGDTLLYYNPYVAMSLIDLAESTIVVKAYSGKQAVFIPFANCGNADDDRNITYILLYNRKKYVYHIRLHGENFENYTIKDNLTEKFKDLPANLKKGFIQLVQSQYKNVIKK
ncbi:hypothetical protein [Flavobacterium foetidum]|uniref:hypothetical protein n=1 Tax=Flavobacterium foetidum TaxID=2026681 RepID=UPI00107569E8|nr:hypothetical protein [Flavobacterium foetidum]KAF2509089.1 hypothetical protein E0W73_18955 [Flavobacterium foetidum]